MQPTKEPELADLILSLLEEGPRTGYEICELLQNRHHVPLKGREGVMYAAFVQLEREGYITGAFELTADGRNRRQYQLPVLMDVGKSEPGDAR